MPLVHASRKCVHVRSLFRVMLASVMSRLERLHCREPGGLRCSSERKGRALSTCSTTQTSEFSLPTACVVTLSQCYPLCCDPLCWALPLHAHIEKFPYEW